MIRLRSALAAPFVLGLVGLLGRHAARHGSAEGLLGAFVAAILIGASSALAIALADAVGSAPRRPHPVPAVVLPSARDRRGYEEPAS